jgi:hypothetical protein
MTITRIQANAAADMVRTIRPAWDAGNTAKVIGELAEGNPLPDVVAAAIVAATNPDNRTPLAIQWEMDRLKAKASPVSGPAGKYADEPRCVVCGMRETRCRYMCSKTSDDHRFIAGY